MDYGVNLGEATSDVLISTPFVWRYGGVNVYLCGSFTGWFGHYPMTPVEGFPRIFQTVCGLPPGYHEYKFFVDGEWRHDENQPFVSGDRGTVNTVLLVVQPDNALSPQMHSRGSNMDVDTEAFQSVVRISDDPLQESMSRVPEVDLEVSRHRISLFLSTHVAYELIPESGKVVTLDVDLPVKQAFHILHEQGIPMAPLWDSFKGQFIGVLSALDFILILRELGSHASNLTEEELETHTISAWKEVKLYLERGTDGNERDSSRQLVHAGPDDNLKSVAIKILQNNVATVPIMYSPLDDSSCPQLLHLASLSEILKCMCRYFKHTSTSLPILQIPVGAFSVGTWVPQIGELNQRPLAMLKSSSSIGSALSLLLQAQVSSIPIVDENNSLVDVYSRSDITALAKDKVYTRMNLEEMTINQALLLAQDPYSPYGYNSQRCNMCLRSDPLYKVMERLSNPGVRRLIVVEAGSKRVQGIIALSDIFKLLVG